MFSQRSAAESARRNREVCPAFRRLDQPFPTLSGVASLSIVYRSSFPPFGPLSAVAPSIFVTTGRVVTITDDRGAFWVRHDGLGSGIVNDDRHDVFTARNMAKSMAGLLDANLSWPD